jgi:hypothetical protein
MHPVTIKGHRTTHPGWRCRWDDCDTGVLIDSRLIFPTSGKPKVK